MKYDFLVKTYETERVKILSGRSEFKEEDLPVRPLQSDPRARSVQEQMVHQCVSEDLWFRNMLGIEVGGPPLPEKETRTGFMKRYAERRQTARYTSAKGRAMVGRTNEVLRCATIQSVGDNPPLDAYVPSSGRRFAIHQGIESDFVI
jgi:hypothetical protein